ncbi:hypothetical protein NIES2104_29180 [Leptolyngbya sp. NIES-2104]|nr:hypothetical protein NIES2104_29180 [Leptolyngbya sp. NIES-2104]
MGDFTRVSGLTAFNPQLSGEKNILMEVFRERGCDRCNSA